MRYGIYKKATGQIDRLVSCLPAMIQKSCAADEGYFATVNETVRDDTHYVDVSTPDNKIVKMPDRPSDKHTFNYSNKLWVITRDFETERRVKLAAANKALAQKFQAPIEYGYGGAVVAIQADDESKDAVILKIAELNALTSRGSTIPDKSPTLVWRTASKTNLNFNTQDEYKAWLEGLLIAISRNRSALRAQYWALKDSIRAATTVEELDNVSLD